MRCYDGCQDLIIAMPVGEKEEFDSFYDQCSEAAMATAAIAMGGASPAKETSCTISEIRSLRSYPQIFLGGEGSYFRNLVLNFFFNNLLQCIFKKYRGSIKVGKI